MCSSDLMISLHNLYDELSGYGTGEDRLPRFEVILCRVMKPNYKSTAWAGDGGYSLQANQQHELYNSRQHELDSHNNNTFIYCLC